MKKIAFGLVLLSAAAAVAMPEIPQNLVHVEQDGHKDTISVSYELTGEPAVVTCTVETNGVDAAGVTRWLPVRTAGTSSLKGELGVLVEPGRYEAKFRPSKACVWAMQTGDFRFTLKAWPTNSPPDWMVVDMMGRERTRYCVSSDELGDVTDDAFKTRYAVLRRIPAAGVEWIMGSPRNATGESGYGNRSFPVPVTLTADYYCSVFELTALQAEYAIDGRGTVKSDVAIADLVPTLRSYDNMRGQAGAGFLGWPAGGHDVASNSGFDKMRKRTGVCFDYLTAAQWEFASRAGLTTALNNGHNLWDNTVSTNADDVAWYDGNSTGAPRGRATQVVGLLKPNAWGLHDMHGNVWEFTLDWFASPGPQSVQVDPCGPAAENPSYAGRTVRGGSYGNAAALLSNGVRYNFTADLAVGVRLWAPCEAVR